jgi:hypothetical protein
MMTEAEQSLALRDTDFEVESTAIEEYGRRPVVRELAGRLLNLHPAAAEVGPEGMLAVAQTAVLIGANPLPGTNEIHVFQDKGKVHIDLGINYFRRRSRELGGVLWRRKPGPMNDVERRDYMIEDGQLAAICEAVRRTDMKDLTSLGMTPNEVWSAAGELGVGTAGAKEYPKKGRPLFWTAQKRAEKDLYRKLFPNLERPPREQIEHEISRWRDDLSPAENDELQRLQAVNDDIQAQIRELTPAELQAKAADNVRALRGDPDFEGFDDLENGPPAKNQTELIIKDDGATAEDGDYDGDAVLVDDEVAQTMGATGATLAEVEGKQAWLLRDVQERTKNSFLTLANVAAALRKANELEDDADLTWPDPEAQNEWVALSDQAATALKE